MEGSVSSSASQPPGETPWKIAASPKRQGRQGAGNRGERNFPHVTDHASRYKSGNPLSSSSRGKPPRPDCFTIALAPPADLMVSLLARAHDMIQSANEATAGIAAIPASRI